MNDKNRELATQKLRQNYVQNNLPYVKPIEYDLGYRDGKHRTFVYIPILSVLKNLLRKSDILGFVLDLEGESANVYSSYKSGKSYSSCSLLQSEPCFLIVGLYQDDFETVNPLGTSKKIHKLGAFYWTLINVPHKYRSSLHMIQTAILAKSVDTKYFGIRKVLEPLLKDLKQLESEGIFVERLGIDVKGYLAYLSADNLGAHTIGGFNECFSGTVKHFCRFCMITSEELSIIHQVNDNFTLRTKFLNEQHIAHITINPEACKLYGVKRESELNNVLDNFHTTTGLPPDIAHDFLEGIVPYELALCFTDFISKHIKALFYTNRVK